MQRPDCTCTNSDPQFGISDKEPIAIVAYDEGDLKVDNPSTKELTVVAIDKCLIADNEPGKRCDGLVFDDLKAVFFEIKDVSPKQRSIKKDEAFKQIIETLSYSSVLHLLTMKQRTEALAVFVNRNIHPAKNTGNQSDAKKTMDSLNMICLEGNHITF